MNDAVGLVTALPLDGRGDPFSPAHVSELLTTHRPDLDALTYALLAAETLDGIHAYQAAGLPQLISDEASRTGPHAGELGCSEPREARAVPPPESPRKRA